MTTVKIADTCDTCGTIHNMWTGPEEHKANAVEPFTDCRIEECNGKIVRTVETYA